MIIGVSRVFLRLMMALEQFLDIKTYSGFQLMNIENRARIISIR